MGQKKVALQRMKTTMAAQGAERTADLGRQHALEEENQQLREINEQAIKQLEEARFDQEKLKSSLLENEESLQNFSMLQTDHLLLKEQYKQLVATKNRLAAAAAEELERLRSLCFG